MNKWLKRLLAAPQLIEAFTLLKADIEAASKDGAIKSALDTLKVDPHVGSQISRISAEWRALEEAVQRLK